MTRLEHGVHAAERTSQWGTVPLDAVVLSLSLLAALVRPADAGATVIAVACSFLLGIYWTVAFLGRRANGEYGRRALHAQIALVSIMIGLIVVLPTLVAIGDRHRTAPFRDIHDSALQIELATGMLLHGQDYYAATYFHTPLEQWWPVGAPNPALYHTDSLPFQEELTIPFMLAARATLGWFDERFIYLGCLGIVIGLAFALARTPSARLTLLAGLGLNPIFVPSFIAGQNDVLVLAEVMGVLLLARSGRRRMSLLLLGTALATKETALFLAPFLLLWMAGQDRPGRERPAPGVTRNPTSAGGVLASGYRLLEPCLWIGLPLAVFVGPFLLWDASAFLASTVGFIEGTVPHSFPIRGLEGYGFATFVLLGHLVASSASYWPFGLVQTLLVGPVAATLLLRQRRDNTLARAVAGFATTLFLAYYFGRFFHASFIAFSLSLFLLAVCLEENGRTQISLDFLILLIVAPQSLARPATPALALTAAVTMGLIVLYALIDVYADGWSFSAQAARVARAGRLRIGLALSVLGVVVVWPEWFAVVSRHAAHPWNYIHDAAMQVEEAVKFLLAGKDYYGQTYAHTAMTHWYSSPAMAAALYHTDRLPFSIVVSLPPYVLARATIGWFDERFVYLVGLFVAIAVLLRLPTSLELRLAALFGILLSPFFVPTLVYGQDDVLVLALLLLFAIGLYQERYRQAALWLGLACATKHTALFMAPPFVAFEWGRHRTAGSWRPRLRAMWNEGWPAAVVPVSICLPFILWNAPAFFADNIGFLAGTAPHSYPIRGVGTYGFSALVLIGRFVRSANAYYPFTLWEIAAAAPLLVIMVWRLRREPSVRDLFAMYALLLFACYFFSRFFQDSGLAYAVVALVLAALMPATTSINAATQTKHGAPNGRQGGATAQASRGATLRKASVTMTGPGFRAMRGRCADGATPPERTVLVAHLSYARDGHHRHSP